MKKYIICAPSFTQNGGGSISMHRLCDLLNEKGYEAYLWKNRADENFVTNPIFNTPTIHTKDFQDFIVIYLEIVSGNPLNAPNVIRWFLNKPGFFTKHINYGKNELYFYYQEVFNDIKLNPHNNKLYVAYFNTDIYKQTNFEKREGNCYILRKGKGRELIHDTKNSVQIDGLSHNEIAKIFNEKKYFYSYDLHTAYTMFAVMCGCIPIVVPFEKLNSKQWQPREELRYGIAYGEEDIDYAISTKNKVIPYINKLHKQSDENVDNFIDISQNFFEHTHKNKTILEEEKLEYIIYLQNTKSKIVYFGASESLYSTVQILEENGIYPDFICDNDKNKTGKFFDKYQISNPNDIFLKEENFCILVTSMYAEEIKIQLQDYSNIEKILSIYD